MLLIPFDIICINRQIPYTAALRAVTTEDFMTAEWTRLPYEVLEKASSRITNEVKGITRVVYDESDDELSIYGAFTDPDNYDEDVLDEYGDE